MPHPTYQYTCRQTQFVQTMLSSLQKEPTENVLHDIRVAIKKIKALHALLHAGNHVSFKTNFPETALVFLQAGKLRDLQVITQCLHSLPAFNAAQYTGHILAAYEKKTARSFLKLFQKKQQVKYMVRELKQLTVLIENRTQEQLNSGYEQLLTRFKTEACATDLHLLRKQIKHLKYQAEALQYKQADLRFQTLLQQLQQCQQILGLWHDWWISNEWVRNHRAFMENAGYFLLLQQTDTEEKKLATDAVTSFQRLLQLL